MKKITYQTTKDLTVIEAEFVEIPKEVTAQEEIVVLKKDVDALVNKASKVLIKAERTMGFARKALTVELQTIQNELETIGWKFVALQKYMKTRERIFMKVAMENVWNNVEEVANKQTKRKVVLLG